MMLITRFLLFWCLLLSCCNEWVTLALVSTTAGRRTGSSRIKSDVILKAVASRRVAVLDGAEWASVQALLPTIPSLTVGAATTKVGYMTVVTGNADSSGDRIMGIQVSSSDVDHDNVVSLDQEVQIYKDSMVSIPANVNDKDAISTMVASLSGVYCSLPRVEGVGGGGESFVSGKVVVMGGSDYACFVSEALAALGATVTLVSTNQKIQLQNKDIDVTTPAVGELDIGFAAAVGEFDALVDTMSDEKGGSSDFLQDEDDPFSLSRGGVVSLLKSQHKCHRYVSTMTEAQRIVRDEGVLFGPGKADKHVSAIQKALSSTMQNSRLASMNNNYRCIVPPKGFSEMVETLLQKGVLFTKTKEKDVSVRTWSLPEFWELASWPRDSSGTNVRFGLPVLDDFDDLPEEMDEEDEMISAPPLTNIQDNRPTIEEEEEEELSSSKQQNPFVMDISDVSGLQREVLSSPRDCVLFMTAPYCQTCRYLAPAYTRMARMVTSSNDKTNVFFAKANTAGKSGKEVSRVLDVETVPTFVMFRGGKRYGTPLSVTRLPSKKLDLAVKYLTSGMEWDNTAFRDMD